MSESIWLTIARLKRAQSRNPDTMVLCEKLEWALHTIQALEDMLARERAERANAPMPKTETDGVFERLDRLGVPTDEEYRRQAKFDRVAYQREYMRKRRAKAKARKAD